jgi:hypothetical protein
LVWVLPNDKAQFFHASHAWAAQSLRGKETCLMSTRDPRDYLPTATPHKGDPDNFALLLQLLDPDLYVNGHILAEASAQNENRIMVRRLKEDMQKLGIHLNRDKLSPITYSDQLNSITISATLQSADRRHDIVGQKCSDFQLDS